MPEGRQDRYKVFVVCYRPDRATPEVHKQKFAEAIKKTPGWAKYFESTWFVATQENAGDIFERLRPHINPMDYLLILRAENSPIGALPKKGWEWFKSVRKVNEGGTG